MVTGYWRLGEKSSWKSAGPEAPESNLQQINGVGKGCSGGNGSPNGIIRSGSSLRKIILRITSNQRVMKESLSDGAKLDYIHHWEEQAGRVLRLSITILGLIISASSVFITLIVTSDQVTLPKNPITGSFDPLVAQMSALPILGEPTSAVLVFIITMGTVISGATALITIFVLAPVQSLEVMDTKMFAEDSEDGEIEDLFIQKRDEWHQTVVFFKYGMVSLILSILLSLPIFVVRNARLATAVLLVLVAIALMIIRQFYPTITYYLWNSTRLDILHMIGGLLFLSVIMARPMNPDPIWDYAALGTLGLPLAAGLVRGYYLEYEHVERFIGRDVVFVAVFGLGSLPTLLVVTDIINGALGAVLFFLMFTIGVASGASIAGLFVGIFAHLVSTTLANQKSRLAPLQEAYANFREK